MNNKLITINLAECKIYLRTTINTLQIKETNRHTQYIPLSYDIVMNDDDIATYRLKVYLNISNDTKIDDNFDMNQIEEQAKTYIKKYITDNNITLQERKYMENVYYTLYQDNKGRLQFWSK